MNSFSAMFKKVWSEDTSSKPAPVSKPSPRKSSAKKKKNKKRKATKSNPGSAKRPASFKKVVKRKQNVPYVHEVKVPVTTKKLVKSTKKIKVLTTVVEEQLDYEIVTEKYTVMEKRMGTRPKEIWVKKIVYEDFEDEVPVVKYRRVKKPVKKFVEREVEIEVEVPSHEVQEVNGYRVDQVEDQREIEVDEVQEYQYMAHMTNSEQTNWKEGEVVTQNRSNRTLGSKVYPTGRRASIDLDSIPLDTTADSSVLASPTKAPMPLNGEIETLPLASTEPVASPIAAANRAAMEQISQHMEDFAPSSNATPTHKAASERRISPFRRYRHLSPKQAQEAQLLHD